MEANWERREGHFEIMIDNAIRTSMIEQATQLAIWKDGTQVVGIAETPLAEYIERITNSELPYPLQRRKMGYIAESMNIAKGVFDGMEVEE